MRKTIAAILACATATLALSGCTVPGARQAPAPSGHRVSRQPNVIVLLADDLGWPDVSAYGISNAA